MSFNGFDSSSIRFHFLYYAQQAKFSAMKTSFDHVRVDVEISACVATKRMNLVGALVIAAG
jgi:hypothetical protein